MKKERTGEVGKKIEERTGRVIREGRSPGGGQMIKKDKKKYS